MSEGGFGVGDNQFEQAVEFAILEDDAGPAKRVEIGEDLCGSGYLGFFAGYMNGVGAKVDGDFESIFKEPKIFIAWAVERLNTGGDFDGLFNQSDS